MTGMSPQTYAPQPPSSAVDPGLGQPWYGIGFLPAFVRAFKKYAVFSGRASRGEYWWFALGSYSISGVLWLAAWSIGLRSGISFVDYSPPSPPSAIKWVFYVAMHAWQLGSLIPSLAVAFRRLHDVNKSGWWYFATFGSGVAAMAIQFLMLAPGVFTVLLFGLLSTAVMVVSVWVIVLLASPTYYYRTKWDPPA